MGTEEVCHLIHVRCEEKPDRFRWEARKETSEGFEVIRKIEYRIEDFKPREIGNQEKGLRPDEITKKDALSYVVWGLRQNLWWIAETDELGMASKMKRGGTWPQTEPISLSTQYRDNIAIIAMAGEIDSINISPWGDYLEKTIDSDVLDIVLDMTGVEFMGEGGLKSFFFSTKRVAKKANFKFALACPQPILQSMFRSIWLDRQFPLYETVNDAVDALEHIEKHKSGTSFIWIDKRCGE